MSLRVTLIHGGGRAGQQAAAVRDIVQAAGVHVRWDEFLAGAASAEGGGAPLPAEMLESVRSNGVALKTKLGPPPERDGGNYNVQFRRELGLFASVRPLRNLRGLPARFQGVDILVVRELTEDLYAAIEHQIVPDVVQSIKVVTAEACQRFLRFAFEWARSAGRKTVHCVHKANILKLSDGLFLEVFREVARGYPGLATREIIVDNCCMQLVSRPRQFDVMVMGNLYGDLVSDLGAGVVGGVNAAAGINFGGAGEDGRPRLRIYESLHGDAAEEHGGVSPLPLLLPAIDLLGAEGYREAADRILSAVEAVLQEGRVRTPDLGGRATTAEMTGAVAEALSR